MNKFWSFSAKPDEQHTDLYILDEIGSRRSWFGDEVTPKQFKRELDEAKGDLHVWLDSPGGDAFAGAAIHDMLREYSTSGRGKVIAMVSLAASAASIIAMAADEIRISVLGTIMIHEPWSRPQGKASELRAVAEVLDTLKEAQITKYMRRTGQSRETIEQLIEGPDGNGTYMNAQQALSLGFADVLMHEDGEPEDAKPTAMMRSLMEVRIASCASRDEERIHDIGLKAARVKSDMIPSDRIICESIEGTELKEWNVELSDDSLADILKSVCSKINGRNDVMDALVCGIRAGLDCWDSIHSAKDQPSEGPDDSMRLLMEAIDSTLDD